MSLKTHSNPAALDNLLSYIDRDPVIQTQLRKMSNAQAQADDEQHARQLAQLKKSDEFKELKKLRAGGKPVSDDYVIDQIMRRRAARSRQQHQQNGGDEQ